MKFLALGLAAVCIGARAQIPQPRPGIPNYDVPVHGDGRFAESKYGKVYFETEGSGPVVILVAGGPGGSHTTFHPWFSRLAARHTVVYFDNVGRGRSDRLKDAAGYTVARDAEDIEAVRQALNVDKIDVIGHSYGGMPAMTYALAYPDHIRRLVISDSLSNAADWQANINNANANAQHQFPEIWSRLMALRKKGMKSSAEEYEGLYGNAEGDVYWYDTDNATRMFRSGDTDGFNNDVYLAMLGDDPEWTVGGTMKSYDPSEKMTHCNVQTLICVGRYDRISTPEIAAKIHMLLPNSKLQVFEKSGHRPWVEEYEKYFEIVGKFLSDEN